MRATLSKSILLLSILTFVIPAHAVTFNATQDADVATGGVWDNFQLGSDPYILANYQFATSVVAHVQFDVSSLPAGSVQSATLRLFHRFNTTDFVSYDVYRVTSSWNELTVTYPTRPTLNPAVYSTLTITDPNTNVWREWDVTSLVSEWVNGASPNFGLAILRNPDEATWPYFAANEGTGNFPELLVTLVPEPSSLGAIGFALVALASRRR